MNGKVLLDGNLDDAVKRQNTAMPSVVWSLQRHGLPGGGLDIAGSANANS